MQNWTKITSFCTYLLCLKNYKTLNLKVSTMKTFSNHRIRLLYSNKRLLSSQPIYKIQNFINGKFEDSLTNEYFDIINPSTNKIIGLAPQSTDYELKQAELGAIEAFKLWKEIPIQQRQRIFFNLQKLIRDHNDDLAQMITTEQGHEILLNWYMMLIYDADIYIYHIGKTLSDAKGDIFRGLEIVESACNIGNLMLGETLENLSNGLDTYTYKQPLGVTAGLYSSIWWLTVYNE